MWLFNRKNRRRRLEARRAASLEGSAWRRFWVSGTPAALLLAAVLYAGVLAMDLTPVDPLPYHKGQFIPQDIHPRLTFQEESERLMRKEQDWINNSMPATFVLNNVLVDRLCGTLKSLPEQVKAATQPGDVPDKTRDLFGLIDPDVLAQWRKYAAEPARKDLDAQVERLRAALGRTYIVSKEDADTQRARSAREFKAVHDGQSSLVSLADMVSIRWPERVAALTRGLTDVFTDKLDPALHTGVEHYLQAMLGSPDSEPLYLPDVKKTDQDREQAIAALLANPPDKVLITYDPKSVLVHGMAGDSTAEGLKEDDLRLLGLEQAEYLRHEGAWQFWGRVLGRSGMLLLVTMLLCVYIVNYRPTLVADLWQATAMTAALLLLLAANKLLVGVLGWRVQTSILPVLMAAVILVIAFDRRMAWVVGMIFAIFTTMQNRGELSWFLIFLIAITAAAMQLDDIRSRSKLIVVSLTAAAVAFVAGTFAWMIESMPWGMILRDNLWLAGSALLAGFFAQGLLPVIERIFGVATSMTLLEWGDASRPVLKRLAMEAPGTYNHSLQLGALCEAAAEAVGARGLLARVGAYYHDVGKINKPDYFVENQAGSSSKHAKLSPAMSLLIIIGHVKDGLEMAREYGLPRILHEFIGSHHGTTLVQYFYQAAAEQRKAEADRAPDEVEFRYPGPKPRTKEAAILMLADASESSVRSMTERTPGKIENQVHTMVTRRLMDGQLDECELTLREVHQIEVSLIKNLTSMYHLRIAYPTPPGQKPSAGELQAAARKEQESTNGKTSPQGK